MNGAVPLRILGIDPGLRITGFGVIEKAGAAQSFARAANQCILSPDSKIHSSLRLMKGGGDACVGC